MAWVLCLAVLLDIAPMDIAHTDIAPTAHLECMTHSEVDMVLMDIVRSDIILTQCIAHLDLAQCTAWVMVQIMVTAVVIQAMLGILHPFIQVI